MENKKFMKWCSFSTGLILMFLFIIAFLDPVVETTQELTLLILAIWNLEMSARLEREANQ